MVAALALGLYSSGIKGFLLQVFCYGNKQVQRFACVSVNAARHVLLARLLARELASCV